MSHNSACGSVGARSLRQYLADAPALESRQRPGFDDRHFVALAALAAFVVGHDPLLPAYALAVGWMLEQVIDLDHHGLVHPGRNHYTFTPFDALTHRMPAPRPLPAMTR